MQRAHDAHCDFTAIRDEYLTEHAAVCITARGAHSSEKTTPSNWSSPKGIESRSARTLSVRALLDYHASLGGPLTPDQARAKVLAAGWCLDGPDFDQLVPAEVYLTGALWPKMDRVMARPTDP